MTPRNTKRQRLEAAGWRHVSGWIPPDAVATDMAVGVTLIELVQNTIILSADEAEIIATTRKPSGRPKKAVMPASEWIKQRYDDAEAQSQRELQRGIYAPE